MSIAPTQITIRPDHEAYSARFPSSAKRLAGERYAFPTIGTDPKGELFGADGPGTEDVVDAVNPLRHIPIVATIYDNVTDSKASVASKLVGGALLGGPVGFFASLADVVFEQATGKSVGSTVYAALTGEETAAATTQFAQAEPNDTPVVEEVAAMVQAPAPAAGPTPEQVAATLQQTQQNISLAMNQIGAADEVDAATIALFGRNVPSAHASYRKAQFMPYLKDVSTSLVM